MEKQNVLKQHQSRNSAIELCRILSMLMIVGCHFATHGGFNFDKQIITIPRLWWYVIELGGNFGVNVFILISGYFLINNNELKINPKKVFKLWGQVFFYSIVFLALSIVLDKRISAVQMIKSLFPITTSAWWFVTTYFVLFLIHPFLNKLLLSLEKKQYQWLLILLLFIWCIVPTFTSYSLVSNELWQFVLIYAIGGYIKLFGSKMKLKSHHFFYLWIAATIVTYSSSVVFMLIGKKIAIFAEHTTFFYGRLSLPTLLRAVFFFMIFEKMTIPNSRLINLISSAAFGVYLIHDSNLIRPLLWETIFVNAQYQDSLFLIPYSIIVVIIVYVVCSIFELIRIGTVEVLYMKVINNKLDRFTAPFERIAERFTTYLFGKE